MAEDVAEAGYVDSLDDDEKLAAGPPSADDLLYESYTFTISLALEEADGADGEALMREDTEPLPGNEVEGTAAAMRRDERSRASELSEATVDASWG